MLYSAIQAQGSPHTLDIFCSFVKEKIMQHKFSLCAGLPESLFYMSALLLFHFYFIAPVERNTWLQESLRGLKYEDADH